MAEKFTRVFLTTDQEDGLEIFISEHDAQSIEKHICTLIGFIHLKQTFQAFVFNKETDDPELNLLITQHNKPEIPKNFALEMEIHIPEIN